MWLTWISTLKIFLNSVNTARLEDFIKCQSLHITGLTIALWSVIRLFLFFSWNYTRNYTRNYVSPAAIFKKPQVHDPETLTADKKLLRAAVLLTSRLPTPHLHWKPSQLITSICLSVRRACTPSRLRHKVQFAAELSASNSVRLHGLLGLRIAGCRQPVCESDRRYTCLLSFIMKAL